MRIIGIDPGLATVGYAIVEGNKKTPIVLDYGVLSTVAGPESQTPYRLLEIKKDLENLLKEYKPEIAVVEKLFFFKNQKTIMQVAGARGVITCLLAEYGVRIVELTPLEIKQSVSGHGRADKKQIIKLMHRYYGIDPDLNKITPDDAADALAMAYCEL
jgi:crossover junction endodeoxyribonuclease RuvC